MIIRREKKKSFRYIHLSSRICSLSRDNSKTRGYLTCIYLFVDYKRYKKSLHILITLCCLYFSLSHQESTKETAVFQMEYPIYSQAILLTNGKEWISHFIFNCSSVCIFICLLKMKYFSSAKYFLKMPFKHMVQYVYTYCRPSAV